MKGKGVNTSGAHGVIFMNVNNLLGGARKVLKIEIFDVDHVNEDTVCSDAIVELRALAQLNYVALSDGVLPVAPVLYGKEIGICCVSNPRRAYCIIEQEHCGVTLQKYLQSRSGPRSIADTFDCIVLQIFHHLYTLQTHAGAMSHCDLHAGNIMVKSHALPVKIKGGLGEYVLPRNHMRVTFIDFGLASMESIFAGAKAWNAQRCMQAHTRTHAHAHAHTHTRTRTRVHARALCVTLFVCPDTALSFAQFRPGLRSHCTSAAINNENVGYDLLRAVGTINGEFKRCRWQPSGHVWYDAVRVRPHMSKTSLFPVSYMELRAEGKPGKGAHIFRFAGAVPQENAMRSSRNGEQPYGAF